MNLLQIGIVVHNYFTPLAFNLTGITKDKYRIKESRQIDKRTKAGRRRKNATILKHQLALNMLDKLKNSEFAMLTVICDSWFISPSFIKGFPSKGFEVIGMLSEKEIKYKTMNGTKITVQNEANKIKTAIKQGERFRSITKSIPIYIEQEDGTKISCKIVFAKKWRSDISSVNKPYIALITTRLDLSDYELRQVYRKRWKIELGFRILKSWFGLIFSKSSQLFETNVALVALAHIRYALLGACKAIHHPDKDLNQVRKILVQEAIYKNIIINVAAGIKNTATKVKTALKKADNLLKDAICEIFIQLVFPMKTRCPFVTYLSRQYKKVLPFYLAI